MGESPEGPGRRLRGPKRSKACEHCKTRKIRCSGYPSPCTSCAQRGDTCRFGTRKIPLRKNVNKSLLMVAPAPAVPPDSVKPFRPNQPGQDAYHGSLQEPERKQATPAIHGGLFIDQVLFGTQAADQERKLSIMVDESLARSRQQLTFADGAYRLTFFSDTRLEFLSTKLGNHKVNDLVRRISTILKNRTKSPDGVSEISPAPGGNSLEPFLDQVAASRYITTYYDRVHPLFPHLDRESFGATVSSPNLSSILSNDPAFSALYHSVLALGCSHGGEGSFEPGKGQAWKLFSIFLSLMPDLERSANLLTALQAVTTAAVYSLGISCLAVEQKIMTQAARMAHDIAPSFAKGSSAKTFRRTFWVLYSIEKMSSFYFGRSSAFIDSDIVTPMPNIPESMFGSFNWTLTFARHSRLLSRAMTTLFSPGICQKDAAYYTTIINDLYEDLEKWRLSLPSGLRPGASVQAHQFRQPVTGPSAIWINYLYYSFRLLLLRSYLQVTGDSSQNEVESHPNMSRDQLIAVSRSILEMITFVDVEPSTPLWLLAGIPICALFVLFDQVIHDPKHPETRSNLALLDIAGGHFSRIEFASGGSLPGSLIAEFAYIAREYVNESTSKRLELDGSRGLCSSNNEWAAPSVHSRMAPQGGENAPGIENANAVLPSQSLQVPQDMTSLNSALYLPAQEPWISESDLLLGIDVMDIFNNMN